MPPDGERPRPHQFCPACGAPPLIPHDTDCPWLRYTPAAWRVEPVMEMNAAKLGLEAAR